jgi:hypothetical protein
LFPLNATTLVLSLAGHLIFGAILGYGLWVSQGRTGRGLSRTGRDLAWSCPPPELAEIRPLDPAAAHPGELALAEEQAVPASNTPAPLPAT